MNAETYRIAGRRRPFENLAPRRLAHGDFDAVAERDLE